MTLRAANPPDDSDSTQGDPCEVIEVCPICDGRMETVYNRNHQKVCVCIDCHSGLTVPDTAWNVARVKRDAKWMPKPPR
jgi:hypothetical protein